MKLEASMRGPWIVQADFEIRSRIPCRYWFQVLDALEDALRRGATEVRIRPVKP